MTGAAVPIFADFLQGAPMPRICIVVLDHRNDSYLQDLVDGVRTFCPDADLAWYNSGGEPPAPGTPAATLPVLPNCRPLRYAKVTPFYFDLFEWAAGQDYDYVVNAETDMAFIRPGYERFVVDHMRGADYLSPGFERAIPADIPWRAYRTLVPELPELLAILGVARLNRGFSPGQVFSARYIHALIGSPWYADLRAFVDRNQEPGRSRTLQEILLPTLPDVLGLTIRENPPHLGFFNRFRPYHREETVRRALATEDVHFVHPVYRHPDDGARRLVRGLLPRYAQQAA
jgi:hypothetical protein